MDLGHRIKEARLASGLSQRQLCGDTITRNMLSRIEHGTVRPSMTTLQFLAQKLDKPISYFLDEAAVTSPNVEVMSHARRCYGAGDFSGTLEILNTYKAPDETFDAEQYLLRAKCYLSLAARAVAEGRLPYAEELLMKAEQAGKLTVYYGPELERERLLLLALMDAEVTLPPDDRELLARAKRALAAGDAGRCAACLDAAEDKTGPEWNYLRGEAHVMAGEYADALPCYLAAEEHFPRQVWPRLENCYQALEDYKMAYCYACKQRE